MSNLRWSVLQDLDRNTRVGANRVHVSRGAKIRTYFTLRYQTVFLYRVSQKAGRRSGALASIIKQTNQVISGADIAWEAEIGAGLILFHPVGVVIGRNVRMGRECVMQQGSPWSGRCVYATAAALPLAW